MKLVVDANILFSAFIKHGKTIELLLNPSLILYTPIFILEEIEKHKNEILEKTKRTEKELIELFSNLLDIVNLIPFEDMKEYLNEAEKISPDEKDTHYFALALKLGCPIWSNDKELKNQNKIKIYSTEDLVSIFEL